MESKRPVDYLAFVRDANSFNKRLALSRSQRLPFIDQQTGIAQADCTLWRSESQRARTDEVGGASCTGGRLYSYPARRWQKMRRGEYLLSSQSLELDQHQETHLSLSGGHERVSYAPDKHQHTRHHHRLGCLAASATAPARVPPTFSTRPLMNHHHHHQQQQQQQQHPQQPPPRADSTGSHSFVDSDSRDQSSATSQSVDSPPQSRHNQLEEEDEQQLCMNLVARLGVELTPPREDNEDEMPPTDSDGFRLRNGRIKPHTSTQQLEESSSRMEKVTKLSKKKNVGQSLMKTKRNETKSNNGRKTTPNNTTNSTKIKTKHEQGRPPRASQMMKDQMKALGVSASASAKSKPYVCPICDQSYKTRPGLSYHFIHAHDTNLPRHLPAKLNVNTSPNRPETTNGNGAKLASTRIQQSTRTVGSGAVQARAKMKGNILERLDGQTSKTKRARCSPEQSISTRRVLRNNSSRLISQLEFEPEPELNSNDTIEDESVERSEKPAREEHARDELQDDTNELDCAASAEQAVCEPVREAAKTDTDEMLDNSEQSSAEGDAEQQQQSAMDKNPEEDGPKETFETHKAAGSDPPEEEPDSKREPQQESVATSCEAAQTCKRQSPFCDFCLGTVDKNRRTRLPEELISCSNCGSSGHPSCLQFSDNIRRSVQLYNWQCIDCKTCSTCNKADHEDQLLFCDDCDRSYHTYCLRPRLDTLPEGNWTCKLCLFDGGAAQSPPNGVVDLKALVDSDVEPPLELAS